MVSPHSVVSSTLKSLQNSKMQKNNQVGADLSLWAKESDKIFTTESTVRELQIVTSPRKNVLQNIQWISHPIFCYYILLKTESLDNAILAFWLA